MNTFKEYARFEILNFLIAKYGFKEYLEIGYQRGVNYDKIRINYKEAVDPAPIGYSSKSEYSVVPNLNLHLVTSDLFFEKNRKKFDVIFIDGLHTYEQVKRDFENSIAALKPGGIVMLHDMNPQDVEHKGKIISGEERAKSFSEGGSWNGDCFKLAIDIYNGCYDYKYFTVDMDQGCMIVYPFQKRNVVTHGVDKTYKELDMNRKAILNLISPSEFLEKALD